MPHAFPPQSMRWGPNGDRFSHGSARDPCVSAPCQELQGCQLVPAHLEHTAAPPRLLSTSKDLVT